VNTPPGYEVEAKHGPDHETVELSVKKTLSILRSQAANGGGPVFPVMEKAYGMTRKG
jgi:hypothetical protein